MSVCACSRAQWPPVRRSRPLPPARVDDFGKDVWAIAFPVPKFQFTSERNVDRRIERERDGMRERE